MKSPTRYPEADGWDYSVFVDAQRAIYEASRHSYRPKSGEHNWWVFRHYNNYQRPLHPVVEGFIKQWRPLDWQQLLLEWPHVSAVDPSRLVYTQSQAKGEADIQTPTSIGKYLAKHWPHVADHLRRDAVAAYSMDEMYFVHTTPEIIQGIEMGPRSCMQSGYGSIPFKHRDKQRMVEWFQNKTNPEPNWDYHPYVVYAPEYGWHMAIRKKDGGFMGRALCLSFEGTNMFVRTYSKRSDDDDSSSSDHILEQWLIAQGYTKRSHWPDGAKLLRMEHPTSYGLFVPYIDGSSCSARKVDDCGAYLVINYGDGELTCDNTDGTADGAGYDERCRDCGCGINTDSDGHGYVELDEDHIVCESCLNNYTLVRGSSRYAAYREYYTNNRNAVELQCGSYSIDEDNPPDGVVELENGEWAEFDDTVRIDDEYYLSTDDNVVELTNEWDGNTYALKENCWQCEGSGNWYHDDDTDDQVELADGYYHRDHLNELTRQGTLPLPFTPAAAPASSWNSPSLIY